MKTLLILMYLAQAADLTTTLIKFHQGCVEASPLPVALHLTTPLRVGLLKGGVVVGYTLTWHAYRTTHPTMVKWASGLGIGAAGVAAAHNWRTTCQ